jgi:hypothetical protein
MPALEFALRIELGYSMTRHSSLHLGHAPSTSQKRLPAEYAQFAKSCASIHMTARFEYSRLANREQQAHVSRILKANPLAALLASHARRNDVCQ